ncbi:hypothetical protein EV182_005019 [Spiromyces aspiralis]|uniref:Uncharacterized protein n=1 Tax=Spiromyces aspiralis TaxID=68401 RepID=A0ACC1HCV6_9FUNG|nr:hypothetical protein EV182_005019 [Spiromyces aspiralis]
MDNQRTENDKNKHNNAISTRLSPRKLIEFYEQRIGNGPGSGLGGAFVARSWIACTSVAGSVHLHICVYLPGRVEKSERDFNILYKELQDMQISQAELKELQWRCTERDRNILELRRTLETTQQALIRERQKHLSVVAENDRLRISRHEDRKMIGYLMSRMHESHEHSSISDEIFNENNKRRRTDQPQRNEDDGESDAGTLKIELETLRLAVDTLKMQLDEQATMTDSRKNNEEIIQGLREELDRCLDQSLAEKQRLVDELEESREQQHKVRTRYRENLAELLDARKQNMRNAQAVQQDRFVMRAEILELQARLDAEVKRNQFIEKSLSSSHNEIQKATIVELEANLQYLRDDLDHALVGA